ncbi:NEDD4-binding protein 3-A-like [Centruroides sculpturatus]|uniref:NEDD4-binding protein 3-A-like n=1 Tax=Centruroides sculpturatus TaxID=218467 RepID=UPI000C6D6545|nr:NEDD4-binding protein 3-A-like [Centruroides sculpturatus]
MISIQNYQIQQEKRKLQVELDESKKEKEASGKQIERLQQELVMIKAQLENTEWSLCQKTDEVSLLKSQLKDSQNDQTSHITEMLILKFQLRETKQLLEEEEEKREAELKERFCQALQNFQLQSHENSLFNNSVEQRGEMQRRGPDETRGGQVGKQIGHCQQKIQSGTEHQNGKDSVDKGESHLLPETTPA